MSQVRSGGRSGACEGRTLLVTHGRVRTQNAWDESAVHVRLASLTG